MFCWLVTLKGNIIVFSTHPTLLKHSYMKQIVVKNSTKDKDHEIKNDEKMQNKIITH